MQFGNFGSIEMEMLWLAAALGIVQVVLVILASAAAGRTAWAVGARDAAEPPLGTIGARLRRALTNFGKTFPLFVAAVLVATTLNKHTQYSEYGAQIYFWARVAYVPAYAMGIPVLRTVIWTIGAVGIAMILLAVYPGM